MLPRFDVEVRVDEIDPDMLRVIWKDEIDDGIGDNRLYTDLTGTDWAEVEEVIAAEEALIMAAESRAGDEAEFESALSEMMDEQYPGEDFDEGPLSAFAVLDVGIMAAVAALSAAGCIPTTSCRGHNSSGEAYPLVRFATDERRLPLIREACRRSDCGLLMDDVGMLQVYASDVVDMRGFARQMITLRADFEVIDGEAACERPDESYLDECGDDLVRKRDLYALLEKMQRDQGIQCPGQLSLFENGTEPV